MNRTASINQQPCLYKIGLLLVFLILFPLCLWSVPLSSVLHPEYTLSVDANRYVIDFVMPEYRIMREDSLDAVEERHFGPWVSMKEDDCPVFDIIDVRADCDYTDITSYPELPFFSIDLLIPYDARNVRVRFLPNDMEEVFFSHYIQPAVSEPDSEEDCFNFQYYKNGMDDTYPKGFYRHYYELSDIYTLDAWQGVTLSIFPFAYYPDLYAAEVLKAGRFIVDFDKGDLTKEISDILQYSDIKATIAKLTFNTFDDYAVELDDRPSYLIVAAQETMAPYLRQYVNYKRGLGYNAQVVYLDQCGKLGCQGEEMADFINKNNGVCSDPDYVLLVGDLKKIPPYSGKDIDTDPYTDDPYHPRISRWIVKEKDGRFPDLSAIITKTMNTEYEYTQSKSSAVLFSGIDEESKSHSRRFFRRIKVAARQSFSKMQVPYTLYDGRSVAVNFNSMKSALQANPRFFVYSGHGYPSSYSGIAHPYDVFPSALQLTNSILSLQNISSPFPMGFGFACTLNTYGINESFGASWLSEQCGGVSFYGATTVSRTTSNYYLCRRLFITLKQLTHRMKNFPISVWIQTAETKYKNALCTEDRKNQALKYSLIGDPTLYLYGREDNGVIAPFQSPRKNYYEETDGISTEKILVFDVMGRLLYQGKSGTDLPLSSGLYILQHITDTNTSSEIKYIQ